MTIDKAEIWKHFNAQLLLSCSLIAVSTFNYGFDNQAFATSQAMDAFTKKFGEYNPTTKKYALETQWLSLFNSLPFLGFALGVIIGSLVSARFGRRMCMCVMSIYAIGTATICVTSQSRNQILAGRVLNYVYIGMELSVVPVFQSEIVPTQVRGFIVGTYQGSLIAGGMVINWVCRGTSGIQDDRAWRIPLGLFYIVPTIIISCIWFIPESPRWLMTRDRHDEALANLRKLRQGTITEDEILQEYETIRIALAEELEQGKFIELFQGNNRKRTAIVVFTNFFQQATGQAFASQYGTLYVKSLGTINPFNFTVINGFVNLSVIVFCLCLNDKVGRRFLLMAGAIVQFAALFTMAGLGLPQKPTFEEKSGIVAMLAIFSAGFSIGWAPLTYVVTTEIPALRLRDHSQRIASVTNVLTFFVVAFTIPYLLYAPYANLQSKLGFIFGSIAALAILFTYFCVPECKQKSLEQIDIMFYEGVPLRKFGSYQGRELNEEAAKEVKAHDLKGATVHVENAVKEGEL